MQRRLIVQMAHRNSGPRYAYAVLTAARDEVDGLAELADAMASQTVPPAAWIIVDDGSVDGTYEHAIDLATRWDWVRVERVANGQARARGAHIGALLSEAAQHIPAAVDLVAIVDADITFDRSYFERLIRRFSANPKLGIASGAREERVAGEWRIRHLTGSSVEAQCRMYRASCLERLLPFERHAGWDGADVAKAQVLGWQTQTFRELRFRHHRPVGARDGSRWRAWANEGRAAWAMHYRPSYLVLRAVYQSTNDLSALALLVGFASGWAQQLPRSSDRQGTALIRNDQRLRHLQQRRRDVTGVPSPRKRASVEIMLVADPGGHLAELWALREAWSTLRSAWVTLDSEQSTSVLRSEEVVHFGRGPTTRSVPSLLWNLVFAYRLARRLRPKVVVACGSGLPVPVAWAARAAGSAVVFVECGGRIDAPSLSLRLVGPVATRIYVQTANLSHVHRRARYAGSIPWNRAVSRAPGKAQRRGTFVTVGTSVKYPFDRLIRALDGLPLPHPIVVQHGVSTADCVGDRTFAFATAAEIEACIAAAQIVVSHAGIGTLMTCYTLGRRPLVMPRSARFGESVDDHQRAFAIERATAGDAIIVEDAAALRAALADALGVQPEPPLERRPDEGGLVDDLRPYLATLVAGG